MSEEIKSNSNEDVTKESNESNESKEQDSSVNQDVVFCSKCGEKNSSSSKFCSKCGNNLKTIEGNIKETTENLKSAISNNETYKNLVGVSKNSSNKASWDNKDMVDFIQKNPEYYIPKFEQMQKYEKSTSWNWASFFIFPLWLLYRKMYTYGFGLIILSFLLSYIPVIGVISTIAIPILGGLFGNSIYLKYIEKKLEEISNLNDDVKHRVIISSGGVNLALPIVMCLFIVIIYFTLVIFSAIAILSYY